MSEQEAINVSSIKPLGRFLLCRKCQTQKPELIEVPEQYIEQCEFVEILAVGGKCKIFSKDNIGCVIRAPEMADGMFNLEEGRSEYWMIREDLVMPVVYE